MPSFAPKGLRLKAQGCRFGLPWEQRQRKNLNRNAVAPRVANTANLLTRDRRNRVAVEKPIAHSPQGSPKRQPSAL